MVLQFFPRLLLTIFLQLGEGPPQGTRGGGGKKTNRYILDGERVKMMGNNQVHQGNLISNAKNRKSDQKRSKSPPE